MSLGQRIRELRETRGLTQQQLGSREVTKGFISLLERDRAKPSLETLAMIARRLGTTLDALVGQEDHIPEAAVQSLLMLARDTVEIDDVETARRYLSMVAFLGERHGLDEPVRERRLLEAQIALRESSYDEAWTALTDVERLSEQAGDRWRLGRALSMMGQVKLKQREFQEARTLLESALTVFRQARAGRDPLRVDTLIYLGSVLVYQGDLETAQRRYAEAAVSFVAKHDHKLRGKALWGLGAVRRKLGQLQRARESLLQAKDAFEAAEELVDLTRVLQNIGQVCLEEGQTRQALRNFEQALQVMERIRKPVDFASLLTEIGKAHYIAGSLEDAREYAMRAIQAAQLAGDPVEVNEAQVVLSRALIAQGKTKDAVSILQEAITGFETRGMRGRLLEIAREFGPLLRGRGAYVEAANLLIHLVGSEQTSTATGPKTR